MHWRYHEKLGCSTIADLLDADLEKYPPPEAPCKARTRSSVYNILCNPKYTGPQVFNRHATTTHSTIPRTNASTSFADESSTAAVVATCIPACRRR